MMKRTIGLILGLGVLAAVGGPRQAESTPAPSGLVAYWNLDETIGSNAVDQIAGNNGAHVNAPTIVTAAASLPPLIQFANAACLDFEESANQYLSVVDAPEISLTGDFTLAAWINPESMPDHQQGIVEKWNWNGSTAEDGYLLRLSNGFNDGTMELSCSIADPPPGGINGASGTTPIATGTWTHVAAKYEGATQLVTIYINGVYETAQGPISPPPDGATTLEIGRGMGAQPFDGMIDDVRIYDCALTGGEIQQLAAGIDVGGGGAPPPPPPPPPGPPAVANVKENDNGDGCSCSTILSQPVSGWLAVFGLGLMFLVRRSGR